MNTFLPASYNVPEAASGYSKLKDGANRFRILSDAIIGYEYWNVANKPVRQKEQFDLIPNDIKYNDDGTVSSIKHFWAFVVWNYDEKMVQILEITQATIQRGLKIKIDNRQGNAANNDFIITRSGKGLLTEYDVDVAEASPVSPEIMAAYEAKPINLEALYTGADPFTATTEIPNTPLSGKEKLANVAYNLSGANKATTSQISVNKEFVADIAAKIDAEIADMKDESEDGLESADVPF